MHALAVLTALATAVSAQSSYTAAASVTSSASLASASDSSNATSTTSGPVTHTVDVGKGGVPSYSPDVVVADVGDIIEFQFYPTNHSVIRAAYGYPCVPYEMVLGAGHYGFYSGQELVDVVLTNPPSWSVRVNDTDPIFYYCGAPNSCIGNGMVGVINPNASTSLDHQRQLAESSSFMLLPGQDWPSEGSIPSGVATNSASVSPTPTSATTVTATPIASSSSHGLSGGAIAGIAVGAAVVLVAAGAALWFCGYKSRQPSGPAPGTAPQEIHPGYAPMAAAMYGKPGHMSVVSGYGMPPGYGDPHQGLRSPIRQTMVPGTPGEPMADPHQQQMMHSGSASPNLQPVAPAYGQGPVVNLLAVGTHNIAPVEMDSSRHSLEKQGVERWLKIHFPS